MKTSTVQPAIGATVGWHVTDHLPCSVCRRTLLLLTLCQLYTTVEIEVILWFLSRMAKCIARPPGQTSFQLQLKTAKYRPKINTNPRTAGLFGLAFISAWFFLWPRCNLLLLSVPASSHPDRWGEEKPGSVCQQSAALYGRVGLHRSWSLSNPLLLLITFQTP